ncbi:MAG: CocE/NonD family hydrolase [Actinomycetota bacterium]
MTVSPARVARRLAGIVRPRVVISDPPSGVVVDWNVPIAIRDGTILRANVFRPASGEPVPVVMCAHPYGKDALPQRRLGRYQPPMQYRVFPQPEAIEFSAWTGWEGPDPAFWVPQGFAVVNLDLRGFGKSDGTGELLSDQQGDDEHDVIEWVAAQPWCTGRVGLLGVSYLAISQYRAAATRPPHLAAICPWEGFTDMYRDFACPGGVRENGFLAMWSKMTLKGGRVTEDPLAEQRARPLIDDWWRSRNPALEQIEVPMLVCGSFSDHLLHSRGSFEAFRRTGSQRKWLWTHRSGKWSAFYAAQARDVQLRFFDHFLRDADNRWEDEPPVRIAVHDGGPDPVAIRHAPDWPPPDVTWTDLHLQPGGMLGDTHATTSGTAEWANADGATRFAWCAPRDIDLIGPLVLDLAVSLDDADDATVLAAVRLVRDGVDVPFEGSYGFDRDVVTHGWLRVSHRALDQERSLDWLPVHAHTRAEPVAPGERVNLSIPLLPQATRLRAGDELVLELRSTWLFPRNPITGQMPARYVPETAGTTRVHLGPEHRNVLRVPIAPNLS